jgi:hypothetical protein
MANIPGGRGNGKRFRGLFRAGALASSPA